MDSEHGKTMSLFGDVLPAKTRKVSVNKEKKKAAYQKRKESGLCVTCGDKVEEGRSKSRCACCLDKVKLAAMRWKKRAREEGKCERCGGKATLHRSKHLCDACAEVNRNSSYSNGLKLIRAGKCRSCGCTRNVNGWEHPWLCAECFHDKAERDAKRSYGVSAEEADELRKRPCDVCGRPASRSKKGTNCIDHDHQTGTVRGTLCHGCNVSEGLMGGDTKRIRALADYLEQHLARLSRAG